MKYVLPVLILLLFLYAFLFKKVKLYDAFTEGAGGAIPLAVKLFPFLAAIFLLTELFEASGLSKAVSNLLSPVFGIFGIPKELTKLVLVKPFSGSGSLALVNEIFTEYGVDSYLARCACVIYGCSETVFYIAAVYFAGTNFRHLLKPIVISLAATFASAVFACFICLVL